MNNLYEDFIEIIPKVLGVIAFIIISYLLLKLILFLVRKSLKLTKLDSLLSKLNDKNPIFSTSSKLQPTKIILMFVKWFLILIFIVVGADILGLTMVSNEVSKIIQYLPKLFTAVLIFFIGTYGAVLLRKTIQSALKSIDVNGAKAISLIVFYFVFVMVAIMTLNQAGIDTEIITKNLFFIICAFLAALTIALGLGSRDVVLRLLLGFYSRKNFPIGKRIKFDDVEGAVIAIDNISLVLEKNDGKKIVIPIKKIANKQVEIID
ncbi:mechanosensitive ion channel [Galbibacter sp. EGI 63066]|uniref:mechanosensitive ion channel family protein n=1 Tax=Galbibacter sp. EGI 63066 TaxID=2993559 RepID=UPI002248AB0D|nr:mechanosensitive ion channel domain-containing protein [Galbibacter sp. EGI 63066]MCX2678415.1 mechanosensitive ion channel [Galbibacter sp. EGI 63066]